MRRLATTQAFFFAVAVALCFGCGSSKPPYAPPPVSPRPVPKSTTQAEVQFSLCLPPGIDLANYSNLQKDLVVQSIGRFSARAANTMGPRSPKYRILLDSTCGELAPMGRQTCRTFGNVIMCDLSVLARARRMAGWMAALTADILLERRVKIGDVPVQLARALSDAESMDAAVSELWKYRRLAEKKWTSQDITDAQTFLQYAVRLELGREVVIESSTPQSTATVTRFGEMAHDISVLASDYVLAFILGHEIYHVSKSCEGLPELPSDVMAELNRLEDLEQHGVGVCRNQPNLDEFWADECGLRHALDAYVHGQYRGTNGDFALRYAIDVTSELLLGGLSDEMGLQEWELNGVRMVRFNRPPGYPYAPLRVLAFSELTKALGSNFEIGICDATGIDVFESLAEAAYCPEQREFRFADQDWLSAFERNFPVRAWYGLGNDPSTAPHNDDDFACGPEDRRLTVRR